jgi:hypothetical protein
VAHDFRQGGGIGRDDGDPSRHGFNRREPEAFHPGWKHEHVEGLHHRRYVAPESQPVHALGVAQVGPHRPLHLSVACDHQVGVGQPWSRGAPGVGEFEHALPVHETAHESEHERVLGNTERGGLRIIERAGVDAVVDHGDGLAAEPGSRVEHDAAGRARVGDDVAREPPVQEAVVQTALEWPGHRAADDDRDAQRPGGQHGGSHVLVRRGQHDLGRVPAQGAPGSEDPDRAPVHAVQHGLHPNLR